MNSSSSLCVVCPPCVYDTPPCEQPCYEGPCSSAPSSGVVVASGTFDGPFDWAFVAAGAGAAAAILGIAVGESLRGIPLVRQSRARR